MKESSIPGLDGFCFTEEGSFCYTSLPCILDYSLKRQNHFTVPTYNALMCLFSDKAEFLSFLCIIINLKVIYNEIIDSMCVSLMITKV